MPVFNQTIEAIAYNINEFECLKVGKYVIDSIPEFRYAVLQSGYEFFLIAFAIRYGSSIFDSIYQKVFKKALLLPYPSTDKVYIKRVLKGFKQALKERKEDKETNEVIIGDDFNFLVPEFKRINIFMKIHDLAILAVEFRILFMIQYLLF